MNDTTADAFTFRGFCPFCRCAAVHVHDESGLCRSCLVAARVGWNPYAPSATRAPWFGGPTATAEQEDDTAVPFCACGRRISECDGSRRGCRRPSMAPLDCYRPIVIGDGFGGRRQGPDCCRAGLVGPCWGECTWREVRDLVHGTALRAVCRAHAGATYRAKTAARVAA